MAPRSVAVGKYEFASAWMVDLPAWHKISERSPSGVLPSHLDNCFKQEAHQLVGQAKRSALKFNPKPLEVAFSAVFRISINTDHK